MMIVLYQKISSRDLKKSAKKAVVQIEQWFKANPKRKVCRSELWYGKLYSIQRKGVAEQIATIVKELGA